MLYFCVVQTDIDLKVKEYEKDFNFSSGRRCNVQYEDCSGPNRRR